MTRTVCGDECQMLSIILLFYITVNIGKRMGVQASEPVTSIDGHIIFHCCSLACFGLCLVVVTPSLDMVSPPLEEVVVSF